MEVREFYNFKIIQQYQFYIPYIFTDSSLQFKKFKKLNLRKTKM